VTGVQTCALPISVQCRRRTPTFLASFERTLHSGNNMNDKRVDVCDVDTVDAAQHCQGNQQLIGGEWTGRQSNEGGTMKSEYVNGHSQGDRSVAVIHILSHSFLLFCTLKGNEQTLDILTTSSHYMAIMIINSSVFNL